MSYEFILSEARGSVGLITLNRPDALNALSDGLMDEVLPFIDHKPSEDFIKDIKLTANKQRAYESKHK